MLGLGVVLGLLVLLEGVLRVAGFGTRVPIFVPFADDPRGGQILASGTDWAAPFFFRDAQGRRVPGGSYTPQYFRMPKPKGVVRVGVFGASTVQGFPYLPGESISRNLEVMLDDALTTAGLDAEVLNLGFTAVASFPVSRAVHEALATADLDAVVVISGHNEFFGAYGVASTQGAGASRWRQSLSEATNATRIVQLTRKAVARVRARSRAGEPGDAQALVQMMAGDSAIGATDPRREAAAALLEENLAAIAADCREAQVPVLFATLPSNLAGFAPTGRAELGAETLDQLKAALELTDHVEGARRVAELAEAQPEEALLQYLLGRAYDDAGDHDRALVALTRARDLDPMPWRATSATNAAIREAAKSADVPLADVEAAFLTASHGRAPGWDLFVDHVHPSTLGRAVYARAIAEALAGVLGGELDADNLPEPSAVAARLGGGSPLTEGPAVLLMAKLFSIEPMGTNNREALMRFQGELQRLDRVATLEERKAFGAFADLQKSGQEGALSPHTLAGIEFLQSGKPARAAAEFRLGRLDHAPFDRGFLQAAWMEAQARAQAGEEFDAALRADLAEAERATTVLIGLEGEDFFLASTLGHLMRLTGRASESRAAMERAATLANTDADRARARAAIAELDRAAPAEQ